MKTLRDCFWEVIYNKALNDKDIVIVCADMGAPALDQFKINLSSQFVNVGIAEQNAVSVAAGLALNGKKVFVYAIAPFVTLRCYEQTKVLLSAMKIPVTLVGVGAGFSYDDSGPTHHTIEDISVMRILPYMTVYNPSSLEQIEQIAEWACSADSPNYIRLDRHALPSAYSADKDFSQGYAVTKKLADINILCTGNILHNALKAAEALEKEGINLGVVDVLSVPCQNERLVDILRKSEKILSLEEHSLPGGFGSYILELANNYDVKTHIKRIGLNFENGYCYTYGGRENMQKACGIDVDSIVKETRKLMG